ncbi:hypothetical protein PTKIN_Ptkin06aG0144300 [Pterospermum kingtungense]
MAADTELKSSSQVLCPSSSNPRSRHPLRRLGSGIAPTIENVVSTVNLCCALDLKAIAFHAHNTEYNPRKFPWVTMRIKEPKTTARIFSSGEMVCTGAESEQQSLLAARRHARIIQKLGFDVKFKGFKILNMVAAYDFKVPLNLIQLSNSHDHCKFSIYEPEVFPGLIYRMKQPRVMVQVFSSGKIAIAGTPSRDEVFKAFENIYPILMSFRVNN